MYAGQCLLSLFGNPEAARALNEQAKAVNSTFGRLAILTAEAAAEAVFPDPPPLLREPLTPEQEARLKDDLAAAANASRLREAQINVF